MAVRWKIAVSPNTDQSVRLYLAGQGGSRKGDLSRFIDPPVRSPLDTTQPAQARVDHEKVVRSDATSARTAGGHAA